MKRKCEIDTDDAGESYLTKHRLIKRILTEAEKSKADDKRTDGKFDILVRSVLEFICYVVRLRADETNFFDKNKTTIRKAVRVLKKKERDKKKASKEKSGEEKDRNLEIANDFDTLFDNEVNVYLEYSRKKEKQNRNSKTLRDIKTLFVKAGLQDVLAESECMAEVILKKSLCLDEEETQCLGEEKSRCMPDNELKHLADETKKVVAGGVDTEARLREEEESVIVASSQSGQENEEQKEQCVRKQLSVIFLKEMNYPEPFFKPGLKNNEYFCYFNSYLQVLFYNPIFAVDFMDAQLRELYEMIPVEEREIRTLFDAFLRELFFEMKYYSGSFIIPNKAFLKLFHANEQEDTFDFRLTLLSGITVANFESFPYEFKYSECDTCKTMFDETSIACSTYLRRIGASEIENLCDKNYHSFETFCEQCQTATNHTNISEFNLNRSPYLELNVYRNYENNRVCRQLAAYVSSFVDVREDITYNLISVICRTNSAVQSGHFISLVKDWYTSEWWIFDDQTVSTCSNPFEDKYRLGAVYLCYASSAALEKAIQNYEETFEKFSDKFYSPIVSLPSDTLATNCNINCVKSLFVKEGPLYAIPKQWLQSHRKELPKSVVCSSCAKIFDKISNDDVLVPLSILKALFKALPANGLSRFKRYNDLKCSKCFEYFTSLIPYKQVYIR